MKKSICISIILFLLLCSIFVFALNEVNIEIEETKYAKAGQLKVSQVNGLLSESYPYIQPVTKYQTHMTEYMNSLLNTPKIHENYYLYCDRHLVRWADLGQPQGGCRALFSFNDYQFGKIESGKSLMILHKDLGYPEMIYPHGNYGAEEIQLIDVNDARVSIAEGVNIDFMASDRIVKKENVERHMSSKYPIDFENYFNSFRIDVLPLIRSGEYKKFRAGNENVKLEVCGNIFPGVYSNEKYNVNTDGFEPIAQTYFHVEKNSRLAPFNCEIRYYKLSNMETNVDINEYKCGSLQPINYVAKGGDLKNIVCIQDHSREMTRLGCPSGCESELAIDINGIKFHFSNKKESNNIDYIPLGIMDINTDPSTVSEISLIYRPSSLDSEYQLHVKNNEERLYIKTDLSEVINMYFDGRESNHAFVELNYGVVEILNERSNVKDVYVLTEKVGFKYLLQFENNRLVQIKLRDSIREEKLEKAYLNVRGIDVLNVDKNNLNLKLKTQTSTDERIMVLEPYGRDEQVPRIQTISQLPDVDIDHERLSQLATHRSRSVIQSTSCTSLNGRCTVFDDVNNMNCEGNQKVYRGLCPGSNNVVCCAPDTEANDRLHASILERYKTIQERVNARIELDLGLDHDYLRQCQDKGFSSWENTRLRAWAEQHKSTINTLRLPGDAIERTDFCEDENTFVKYYCELLDGVVGTGTVRISCLSNERCIAGRGCVVP